LAKIVVCEDDPVIMKAIVVTLQGSGHDLITAADSLACLDAVERERPELLLTDVAMPGLSGYELIDAIRSRPDLQHVGVVLVSAAAHQPEIEEGYRRGAVDYITKPFRPADLRIRIEQALDRGR
jgi:two-component system, OmpR family, alkaline phosphatase synthesis response regulator PhoP